MNTQRREFLKQAAGVAFAAMAHGAEAERYRLGCQTLPYSALPFPRALEGIRKAGYRYVMLGSDHMKQPVFSPALSASGRTDFRNQLKDSGLEPFMSFLGLTSNVLTPEGSRHWLAELDLCAEFGIHTVVIMGPRYYVRFPAQPKRIADWEKDVTEFYAAITPAIERASKLGIVITVKPHAGIASTAKAALEVLRRQPSDNFKICWDAGNVSYYEGIHPDPDLPDIAANVKAVCIKDHLGLRGQDNFPVPGTGQVNHEEMFRILFGAGFKGPMAVERVDGTDKQANMSAELIDQRIAAARAYLVPLLDKVTGA
jgi:sugar phosphate isomerase/epimerase